jgi:hypothetical protein
MDFARMEIASRRAAEVMTRIADACAEMRVLLGEIGEAANGDIALTAPRQQQRRRRQEKPSAPAATPATEPTPEPEPAMAAQIAASRSFEDEVDAKPDPRLVVASQHEARPRFNKTAMPINPLRVVAAGGER